MSDRELLELAAKAAGFKIQYSDNWGDFSIGEPYSKGEVRWNPLTDDGDALRLAVKLRLEMQHSSDDGAWAVSVGPPSLIGPLEIENYDIGDGLAATRRAIVRAAAEIGKQS